MKCEHLIAVLFNGQGDYCEEWRGDRVLPGCFIQVVNAEQLKLLESGKARFMADRTLVMIK